jgi:hypothetical protein
MNLKYLIGYGYITYEKREKSNSNIYTIEFNPKENKKVLEEIETKRLKIKSKNKKYTAKTSDGNKSNEKHTNVSIPDYPEHSIPDNPEHSIPDYPEHSIPDNPEPINTIEKYHRISNNNNKESKCKNMDNSKKINNPSTTTKNHTKKETETSEIQKNITEEYKKLNTNKISKLIELKDKFEKITKCTTTLKYITDITKESGAKNLEKTLNKFNKIRPTGQVKNVHGLIRSATREEAKGNGYNENKGLKAIEQQKVIQKPVQATNFEQREYDDEFFENMYDNL